jgi:hypothetical protein
MGLEGPALVNLTKLRCLLATGDDLRPMGFSPFISWVHQVARIFAARWHLFVGLDDSFEESFIPLGFLSEVWMNVGCQLL